jgi:hypothetical protein
LRQQPLVTWKLDAPAVEQRKKFDVQLRARLRRRALWSQRSARDHAPGRGLLEIIVSGFFRLMPPPIVAASGRLVVLSECGFRGRLGNFPHSVNPVAQCQVTTITVQEDPRSYLEG